MASICGMKELVHEVVYEGNLVHPISIRIGSIINLVKDWVFSITKVNKLTVKI